MCFRIWKLRVAEPADAEVGGKKQNKKQPKEKGSTLTIWGCQKWGHNQFITVRGKAICSNSVKRKQGFTGARRHGPALLLFLRLSSVKLSWKSLMSDYGLRVWISMRCGFPTRRNVFIISCNDSLDNNSFSSEGISIKMEESIKMLYARIYKLGNFLDYCNHLQNWLFPCGIDRFQQRSLTTSTFSGIYSYWSLKQVTIPHPPCCSWSQGQTDFQRS